MGSHVIDERTLSTVQGTAFSMSKHLIELFDETSIKKTIDISSLSQQEESKQVAKKNDMESYQVVAMDEAR